MLTVNNLVGFGSGGSGGISTKWRLAMSGKAETGGNTYSVPECEMRATAGGADQCIGGTATASSTWVPYPENYSASYAFNDTLLYGYWSSYYLNASTNPNPIYLQYEFPSPVSVTQVALFKGVGDYGGTLSAGPSISLQYWDGVEWVTVATWIDQPNNTDLVLNVE